MLRSKCISRHTTHITQSFRRCYIQVPKLSFTDIESTVPTEFQIKKAETNTAPPSMSRIDLSEYAINKKSVSNDGDNSENLIVRISDLPSWYERLDKPSSYSITDDKSLIEVPTLYRSFQRCYARVLALYTDTYLSLSDSKMKELQNKLQDHDLPEHAQKQLVKINVATRKLTELSSNTYTLFQRLKFKRLTPPFYIHQQFLINLDEENIGRLLELYFELPHPRPLHLKREEFERFMRILLKLKISGDHQVLLPKLVEFYDDIRQNGQGIQLTSFETTKYFSFLLNLWKKENLPMDTRFERIIDMKNKKGPEKLVFVPAMWNIFLSHFPDRVDEIMNLMAKECGLTRSTAEIFLQNLKTLDSLNNTLELMKLKKFHLDPYLLDIILEKYIEFGKPKEALQLLTKILATFEDITDMNWVIPSKSIQRKNIFKIDVLNKTFQQFHKDDEMSKFSWLKYKFKPNPLVVGKLLLSLDTYSRYQLLKLMNHQNIPLANKHALEIIKQHHLHSLPHILKLVNLSQEFNRQLHRNIGDNKYDAKYLSNFVLNKNDPIVETNEIFDQSVSIYKQHEHDENINSIKSEIAVELIKFDKYKAM